MHLYDEGRCEEVAVEADRALAIRPQFTMAFWLKGLCREGRRDWAGAEREFKAALAIVAQDGRALPAIGHLYGVSGRRTEALAIVAELEKLKASGKPVDYALALVHTGLGQKDEAFRWLDSGFRDHDPSMPYAGVEQRFIPLRSDKRFAELVTRLRLPLPAGVPGR